MHAYTILIYVGTPEARRTLAILIDLFFEDLPQIFLPVYFLFLTGIVTEFAIISLSGSILMSIKNIYVLIKYLYWDYKDAINNSSTITEAAINMSSVYDKKTILDSNVASQPVVYKQDFDQLAQRVDLLETQMAELLVAKPN